VNIERVVRDRRKVKIFSVKFFENSRCVVKRVAVGWGVAVVIWWWYQSTRWVMAVILVVVSLKSDDY
jgi:hypothetical protein